MTGDNGMAVLEPELEARLRRGLALLAEQTPEPRSRRPWLQVAAVAVLVAAAGTGIGLAVTSNDSRPIGHRAGPTAPPVASTAPPSSGPTVIGQGVPYDLARLVAESPRIVVGTVTHVTHGEASDASGGLPYVLADITIDRTVRGKVTDSVVAFDYDYGNAITSDSAHGATFTVGERVLLFLSSAAGTVHEHLGRPHWQVTGGAAGEYRMRGDEPDAPFTIEQITSLLPK